MNKSCYKHFEAVQVRELNCFEYRAKWLETCQTSDKEI